MRIFLLIALLSTPAYAGLWEDTQALGTQYEDHREELTVHVSERSRAIAAQVADVVLTCQGLHEGATEANPLYGSLPTCERVALTRAAVVGAMLLVMRKEDKNSKGWKSIFWVSLLPVAWNLYGLDQI